jgi:hypothetical protein
MTHDPAAFTGYFEHTLMQAIAPFQEAQLDEESVRGLVAAVREVVQGHVDVGNLPLTAAGADRLAVVVASTLAFQSPALASLALPAEERARPFAGMIGEDLRVLRERFAGWVATQADEEACHLVLEGTVRAMLDGEGSPLG